MTPAACLAGPGHDFMVGPISTDGPTFQSGIDAGYLTQRWAVQLKCSHCGLQRQAHFFARVRKGPAKPKEAGFGRPPMPEPGEGEKRPTAASRVARRSG